MRHDVSNFSTSVHVNKGRHKHSFKERVLVKALKIKVVPPRVNVWLLGPNTITVVLSVFGSSRPL